MLSRSDGAGVTGDDTASSRAAAAARCSGRGRETSLARIAPLSVIFMAAMRISLGQKITGHQGDGSQDIAADSGASAPGRSSVTSPAAASVPSRVPPR